MHGKDILLSRLPVLVLIGLLPIWTRAVQASPGSCFEVTRIDPAPLLGCLTERYGSLSANQGELIQVGPAGGVLQTKQARQTFRFHRDAVIYVNGRPACPGSAKPVGAEQFFWVELWQSRIGEVVVMEAVYCGGELRIISASPEFVTGFAPETGMVLCLPVAASCRRTWLSPGDAVYALLDLEGKIRYLQRLDDSLPAQ